MEAGKAGGAEPLTPMQKKLQKLMSDLFHVEVTKFEGYAIDSLTVKKTVQGKQVEEIDEAKLRQRVYTTPIEELGIETSAMDDQVINNVPKRPVLVEIKEMRNVSQPFQRGVEKSTKDDPEKEKKKQRKLKNQTYQLKAHDGKRLLKIILLFLDQGPFVRGLFEVNKFTLHGAYLTPAEPNTFVIDQPEQIVSLYTDRYSAPLKEEYQMLQGLPIKYTSAPRFVFLNDRATEEGEHQEKEQEDEFADVFRAFEVPDLTGSERTFIKRFEQLGIWRKKFDNVPITTKEEKNE